MFFDKLCDDILETTLPPRLWGELLNYKSRKF